jgi:hypothetical protein
VIVRDKVKALAFRLEGNGRLDHPKVVSDVQNAARLDAGKYAHWEWFRCGEIDSRFSQSLTLRALSMSHRSRGLNSPSVPRMTNGNGSPTTPLPRKFAA